MRIVAYAGPSVPREDRMLFAGVEWRPPAEAGDLLRLDAGPGTTLCLIDGYFDHRPAVRHKEILLLLAEGVRILGASSIGALRAAEMQDFGLVGIGAIFRAFAAGRIDGDDEVALIHAGPDRDWRPFSLPLVDVRASLLRARRGRAVSRDEGRALLAAARSIHYVDRTWAGIVAESGSSRPGLPGLLEDGAVPLKRLDARECLRAAQANRPPGRRPAMVRTPFLDWLGDQCGTAVGERCQALGAPVLETPAISSDSRGDSGLSPRPTAQRVGVPETGRLDHG